jgi:L-lactate dehydrogenase
MAKKRVLGVVGMGHVGAHVAYALAIQGIADELVLVDQNEQKLASEVQDLRDAVAYMPHRVTVRGGDFSDLGVCDVIVNSVGKIDLLRGTHDRVTEMDFTIPAVRGYAEKIKASGFDGVLINITNPCDIVTRELALHLGLPRGRVFGTGTGLDTSRLLSALARQTGLDHKSITCYMMGEHGNQQFAPWSCVSFRGVPLDEWAKTDERFRFDRDALQKESIGGGSPASSAPSMASPPPPRAWPTPCCTTRRSSCPPARNCAASTAKRACSRVFPASSVKTASSRSSSCR